MDSEQCLNVFVGCPPLLRKLPDGPCLLLDADQDVLDAFQAQYPTKDHKDFVCLESKVLAAPDDGSVIWRRFSDSRFNGVWNLCEWLEIAPKPCKMYYKFQLHNNFSQQQTIKFSLHKNEQIVSQKYCTKLIQFQHSLIVFK